MTILLDFVRVIIRERQHTVQTISKMMQIKRKLDSGMIKINNSAEEIPLGFIWAGMTVEEAMSSIDDTLYTIEEAMSSIDDMLYTIVEAMSSVDDTLYTIVEAMSSIDDTLDTMWSKMKQPLVKRSYSTDQQT